MSVYDERDELVALIDQRIDLAARRLIARTVDLDGRHSRVNVAAGPIQSSEAVSDLHDPLHVPHLPGVNVRREGGKHGGEEGTVGEQFRAQADRLRLLAERIEQDLNSWAVHGGLQPLAECLRQLAHLLGLDVDFVHSLAPSSVGPDGSVGVASAVVEEAAADATGPGGAS